MGLSSALFTGLSGLDANQSWLNTIGNNIANSNTTAFKISDVSFTPEFYQTDHASTAPDGTFGGSNPSQQGNGVQVSTVTRDFKQGAIQSTGVDTNVAISGDGFFVLNTVNGQQYTRDGTFSLNATKQLVGASGAYVQGFAADTNGNIISGQLANLTIPLGQLTQAKATTLSKLQGNLNAGGTVANGASILTSQAFTNTAGTAPAASDLLVNLRTTGATPAALVNSGETLSVTGTRGSRALQSQSFLVTATSTVSDLQTFLNQALNIDTTVSEPGNPTPGTTLQTTGTTGQLTIIGNTGSANVLTLGTAGLVDSATNTTPFNFSGGTFGTFTNNPSGESTHTSLSVYDSLGNPVTVDVTAVLESTSSAGDVWRFYATSNQSTAATGPILGNGTLTYNTSGQLVATTGTSLSIDRAGTGAVTPLSINLDFSGTSAYASSASSLVENFQDGEPIGSLSAFSIGADGTISGSFTNGLTKTLGQLALATFNNDQGLIDEGGNNFIAGANSGNAKIQVPNTQGVGAVKNNALEQSNVDISHEFVNLIIASTGYSAASKVISTSDQLLQQLIQSQR